MELKIPPIPAGFRNMAEKGEYCFNLSEEVITTTDSKISLKQYKISNKNTDVQWHIFLRLWQNTDSYL